MPNCNFNACFSGPYYPRQICTCNCGGGNACPGGSVVNPVQQKEWGVFELSDPVVVQANQEITLTKSMSSGSAVSKDLQGDFFLTAGVYQISYNANFEVPASGKVMLCLELGSVCLPATQSVFTGSVGGINSLSKQIILNLTQSQKLSLLNKTGEAVNFQSANLSINKI